MVFQSRKNGVKAVTVQKTRAKLSKRLGRRLSVHCMLQQIDCGFSNGELYRSSFTDRLDLRNDHHSLINVAV